MFQSIANHFVLAWGWRRALYAFLAGALSALALAPVNFFPVLWLTFPVFVWLMDGAVDRTRSGRLARLRPAAILGWCFGFGYFLAGLWWIGYAFLVEADIFGWLLPLAVIALPAGLALFWALGAAAARLFWSESPGRILVLAIAFGLAEWLRGHLFTGFPWNGLGYLLAANGVQMQAAALVGVEAMAVLAVVIFAAPALLATPDRAGRGQRIFVVALAAVLYGGVLAYGVVRLQGATDERREDVRLRIVQPAIPQADKWKPENRKRIFESYLELSARATSPDRIGLLGVTHLIWPESAFPFLLTENPDALAAIADLLPPGTVLITGAVRAEPASVGPNRRYFNSIYVINHEGTIVDAYDKVRLVPFGEYLPAQDFLEAIGLEQLTRLKGGFSAGVARKALTIPGAPPAAPSICYEIIFPGAEHTEDRPAAWILNVTNDAWFGDSPGPYQHLQQARLRAVEAGIPVVRAANTGISAIIDPYGRIIAKQPLNLGGVIDNTLPSANLHTTYSRLGDISIFGFCAILAILTMFLKRRRLQ
ncbi:apolipoprotein N-acyltransferase [Rhodobium gokarnense]|uniref:Apolipoprotein N-acyltransferase n=1 Tax=Rhodobium gokarnense TaxID=364296 RepID=A0ABT3HI47_9HYPH|nr:apolipoprotein N-acyltransferase [Rhodobium gokarnense]MCW2310091.1 apolipoprotein N-acyltransferase [Rhodobium gokarnense]